MIKNIYCRNLHIGLENFPNIDSPDSDYPDGAIRDNPGDNTGTPFNTVVYGDIHQFFAKLMREAGLSPNGLPDNEYSGNQLFQALRLAANPFTYYSGLISQSSTSAPTLVDAVDFTYAPVITWSRNSQGVYHGQSASNFPGQITILNGGILGFFVADQLASDTVRIKTYNTSSALTDGLLNFTSLMIICHPS